MKLVEVIRFIFTRPAPALFLMLALAQAALHGQSLLPAKLTVESLENPLGIDRTDPRLGWQFSAVQADARDLRQTAWQVLVGEDPTALAAGKGTLWDSGKMAGGINRYIHYAGKPLVSSGRYYWAVRVWDQDDKASPWSAPACWTMGLLAQKDWQGTWISRGGEGNTEDWPSLAGEQWVWYPEKSGNPVSSAPKGKRWFRSTLTIPAGRKLVSAKMVLLADNRFELRVNGKSCAKGELDDGPAAVDLTECLRPGTNALALEVMNTEDSPAGWIGRHVLKLDDGSEIAGGSGKGWLASDEVAGNWDSPGGTGRGWSPVKSLGNYGIAPWTKRGDAPQPGLAAPFFRKPFTISKPVKRATLHVCGLGYHEVSLNGGKVGDHVLDPAFTRYDKRRLYVTHDVTERLKPGENVIGAILGNGWLNVNAKAAWNFDKAAWRADPMLRAQLEIEYADDSKETVVSDSSWKSAEGPIRCDELLLGETYDARREMPGWNRAGFRDANWQPVSVVKSPPGQLSAQVMPPIRATGSFRPLKFTEPKPGVFVFHFPQNIAGVARLHVRGAAGTEVTLAYGEKLNKDGSLDQTQIKRHTYRGEFQTDRYILKGQAEEVWQARFMYHGFQYVEVRGLPGKPTLDTLEAVVEHTDLASAGEFTCSSELLEKIQQATRWSFLNNFHGHPTDCPHREKNGWTGDAHLAVETGLYNFAAESGYTKWMADFQDEQRSSGELPGIIPTAGWGYSWGNGPAWDSAYILIPWAVYQMRGDTDLLARHYPNFKRYVDYLGTRAKDHIVDIGLGDWVPVKTETPVAVTSTAYYYRDALLLSQIAGVLGNKADEENYSKLAEKISASFQREFFKEKTGSYANGSQTALSCALYQDLVPEGKRDAIATTLADAVKARDGHLDCGILGTKYLLHALSDNGRHDIAYGIATQTTEPSWGRWIEQGATTLWENWDGSDSLNHIMFGDISAWCFQNLAGIRPAKPGFEVIRIEPRMSPGLDWVKASHETPQGTVAVRWKREGDSLLVETTVPPNSSAEVVLPATTETAVTENGIPAKQAKGVHGMVYQNSLATISTGSGKYRFLTKLPR